MLKFANASGKESAEISFPMFQLLNVTEKVGGLVFYTISSKSGLQNGAAKLLQCCLSKKNILLLLPISSLQKLNSL